MNFSKKNIRMIMFLIVFTIAISWAFQGIHLLPQTVSAILAFLQPVLLGLGLAYVLNIPTRFLENLLFAKPWKRLDGLRKKLARPLSLFISVVVILAIIVGVFFLVVPTLVETIHQLIIAIPGSVQRAQAWFDKLQENFPRLGEFADFVGFDLNEIGNKAIVWLSKIGTQLLNSTVSFSVGLASFLVSLIIATMLSFYIILQKEKISRWGSSLMYAVLPHRGADKLSGFLKLADRCFHNFLTGQIVEATIFGSLVTIVLTLSGFRYAALIGVFSGITAIIPVLGAWIGGIVGALLQLTVAPRMALIFLLVFLLVQQVEGNLIYPRVVGKRVGLPALLVLTGVVLGGNFGGIVGSFISIPLLSIAYELLNLFIEYRLEQNPDKLEAVEERTAAVTADMRHYKDSRATVSEIFFRRKKDRPAEAEGDKAGAGPSRRKSEAEEASDSDVPSEKSAGPTGSVEGENNDRSDKSSRDKEES